MRPLALLAAALALAGLAVLAYAASLGQASVAFVLLFPVLFAAGPWGFLGGVLLMAGVVLGFANLARSTLHGTLPEAESTYVLGDAPPRTERWPPGAADPSPRPKAQSGGFLLLGPIPIALGSTRGMAVAMLLIALLFLAFVMVLPLFLRGPG